MQGDSRTQVRGTVAQREVGCISTNEVDSEGVINRIFGAPAAAVFPAIREGKTSPVLRLECS